MIKASKLPNAWPAMALLFWHVGASAVAESEAKPVLQLREPDAQETEVALACSEGHCRSVACPANAMKDSWDTSSLATHIWNRTKLRK